jgi:hypothetical protein
LGLCDFHGLPQLLASNQQHPEGINIKAAIATWMELQNSVNGKLLAFAR